MYLRLTGQDGQKMQILSLPEVMLENILSFLSHDEIAKTRLVCKTFNQICMRMLNRGFLSIERRHSLALKTVKARLPRRESERRYHPLSRHCDILSSIETRISMLNMTYTKFIESGMCCFIPGKVIDEIRRVLVLVETSETPPRAHEVLQELRDISSMAIEHFDDKISPAFRKRLHQNQSTCSAAVNYHTGSSLNAAVIKQELAQVRRQTLMDVKLCLFLAKQYKKCYKRMATYKKIAFQHRKTIRELKRKQNDQDICIADLKKRIDECDIKYTELTHTNQAVGGKTIAVSAQPSVSTGASQAQPLRHFASQIKLDLSVLPIGTSGRNAGKCLPNIKPRKPRIKLPSLSDDSEPPQKKTKTETQQPEQPSPVDKDRTQTAMAKIRDFAKEIRNLTRNENEGSCKLQKRPSASNDDVVPVVEKKRKVD